MITGKTDDPGKYAMRTIEFETLNSKFLRVVAKICYKNLSKNWQWHEYFK